MNNHMISKDSTSVIFTGDIGFDKYMSQKWEDKDFISPKLLDFFKSSNHVCINVEGAILDSINADQNGQFFHSMSPDAIGVFDKIGADIWSLGNNHIMDADTDGLISTLSYAKKNNALTIGAGLNAEEASKPVFLDEAGGIGIIGVTYICESLPASETQAGYFSWNDMEYIQERIKEIKSKCRWCVIVAHGGEEFASMPIPYTRERFLKYLDMGADVVVAHHPHVPENYEITEDGKLIFYSLGNFIFDTNYQRVHRHTDTGVLLKLLFSRDKVEFEAIGTKINRQNERLDISELPDIFTNISSLEYELLSPLSAKAFICSEMKKMKYLNPERFSNADQNEWHKYFFSDEPDGYTKGEHMDLAIIFNHSTEEENKSWEKSELKKVINHLQMLINE